MNRQSTDDTFRSLGRHYVRQEGDILWIRLTCEFSLTEMAELFALFDTLYEQYGYAMCLGDAARAKVSSAEARRYQAERLKERVYPSYTAVYGASTVVTTLVSLTERAIELVTKAKMPHSFHKDEATARERLERERPLLQAQATQRR